MERFAWADGFQVRDAAECLGRKHSTLQFRVSGGGNGSIMAGPDGATAPTLDGGERGYDRTVIRGARFQVD